MSSQSTTPTARQEPVPVPRPSKPRTPFLLRPGFPFDPARVPFFYGWVVVAASVLGVAMSIPGQTMGVSVFTDHLIGALGVSRLDLSNAYLVGTLASSALLPFGGRLLDRFGVRVAVVASSVLLGLTLVVLSVSDVITATLGRLLGIENGSLVAVGVLIAGFTALRFSGQGMLTMASRNMLAKWFQRRRGFATGLASVFKSFSFGAAPLALAALVAGFGWRGAWLALALLVGVGMSFLGWLLFRDNPEECGLQMDGPFAEKADIRNPNGGPQRAEVDFTRGQALRTLGFWTVALALSFHALIITGVTFHIVSIGAQAGLNAAAAVSIFLPIALVSTLTGIGVGVTSDRVRIKYIVAFMMLATAVGLVAMVWFETIAGRVLAILGLGVSAGCFSVLSNVALPRFFGRTHLGAIGGVQMSSMVVGSALGPSVLALSYSLTGAYTTAFFAFMTLPGIVLLLAPFTRNPQETAEAAS